jgi:hypothetical protein
MQNIKIIRYIYLKGMVEKDVVTYLNFPLPILGWDEYVKLHTISFMTADAPFGIGSEYLLNTSQT